MPRVRALGLIARRRKDTRLIPIRIAYLYSLRMEAKHTTGRLRSFVLVLALAGSAALGQACAPAVIGAGAGAAGAAYFTSRGAKAAVKGAPDHLQAVSQRVLSEQGIELTEQKVEKGGAERELKGKRGDLDISITIERRDDRTSDVEVTARENAVEWNKQYAESLLNEIIRRS
jgi:hypothetical protein